ncbi:dynamin family protein [Pseudonocardia sp. RS11V-5]|uniref:dynamin family protein n=1 Tax=Pseudonocardia terrae TaxID=2905831 RepID=UPI001E437F75|nr:dynamin family protein [Pseudonocardia terrae]MCE3553819.1 dynamin family protein [Pseudonocardia terrae]
MTRSFDGVLLDNAHVDSALVDSALVDSALVDSALSDSALFDAARPVLGDDAVDACLRRLHAPLRIALAGTLKAGKSTLLNALIGHSVAPTDATECTRVVTTYRRAPAPVAEAVHDGGRRTPIRWPPDGTGKALHSLEVGLPAPLLERYTLVDTPGTSSNSRAVSARTLAYLDPDDGVCEADAVVYLLRSLHDSDLALLRRVQAQVGRGGPLGVVGVLSRADEDGPTPAELRDDPRLDGLPRDFLPVSGLLALRGRTLRQDEFTALAALARRPVAELDAALVSPGRFLAATGHDGLLDAWGMHGIAEAVALVRGGATTAPALAAALIRRSGLEGLTRILEARIGERAAALRMRAALRELRGRLAGRATRLVAGIDRALADDHALVELRTLGALPGLTTLPVPTRIALDRVLGGAGTRPTVRLGLPAGVSGREMHAAAVRAAMHWRRRLDDPLLDPRARRALRAAVRSCEGVAAGAAVRTRAS